jgi:eukaryotic-like serine/threonine-protein kinase
MVADCDRETPFLARPAGERFAALLEDEVDVPLTGTLGGMYQIEREIGRGGMARVYLADDLKHGRRVAVKVIRPNLAASLGRERFLREIGIAARLRHPNIVPLYDSGDADGVLFFVMPYEEGSSLRARLETGDSFTVAERMSTLRDVARALAYAHEQGVVHRDIKPDNVMLSGGAAVVADFGIAKALTLAQGNTEAGALERPDAAIGTPAYMAPEQALGDPATDHRADIYSFGCLAYEIFVGSPPSNDARMKESIATDAPSGVGALIMQCLEKDPAARPSSARELLIRLDAEAAPAVPPRRRRAVMIPIAAAFLSVVGVGAFFVARDRTPARALESNERTVAVLPLQSLGGDSVQQDLANGLSDEIALALFQVPGIRVLSRRGVSNYGGERNVDPKIIGEKLGARFLVMGSLREATGHLVVLTQLIDSRDARVLWAGRFDRDESDLGLVRDAIARSVGDTLRRITGVSMHASNPVLAAHVPNNVAYRLYVLAQRAMYKRGLSIQQNVDMFRRATELDTLYANAYSGLSMALALSPFFQPPPAQAVGPEATRAAQRALQLDPTLVQPHVALGLVHQHAYDWDGAEKEFRAAVAIDGRDVEARVQYGRHLLFRDRPSEALTQFLAASKEDPASALVSSWVSYTYYVSGRLENAVAESNRAFEDDSTNTTTLCLGALVRLKAGQLREARDFVARGQQTNEVLFYVLAATGDSAIAMERVRKLENMPRGGYRTKTSRAYAMLGAADTAGALTALEGATDAHEIWPTLESFRDPIFDSVRGSDRFKRLLRRVGLR